MALHTNLPIYSAAFDLMGVIVDAVKNMPRDVKPVIGARIVDRCLEITTLIRRAKVHRAFYDQHAANYPSSSAVAHQTYADNKMGRPRSNKSSGSGGST